MDSFQMMFLEAVSIGNTTKIKEMLNNGMVDVKFKHKINGWNALHWAARRNYYNICCDLISYGFDPKEKTGDGKTAYELLPINSSENLKNLLFIEEIENNNKERMVIQGNGCNFTPNYIKYPPFPHLNNNKNETFNKTNNQSSLAESPATPNTDKKFSYGRRGSDVRTRFILVRTCCIDGKEAFKRVTLPGGATVESLKLTIEKAMKQGNVLQVITLPDNIIIENDDQIKEFSDCQKVEVVFDTISERYLEKDSYSSSKVPILKNNSILERTVSDTKKVDNHSYKKEIRKGNYTKTMSEIDDKIDNAEQFSGIENSKDGFVSDEMNSGEEQEKKNSYVTIENDFTQESLSVESPVFDIITTDAIFENNDSENISVIKKVSKKKIDPNSVIDSDAVDHGLRHVASTPRHQFKAEHVENHVSPKVSLEKREQEARERQQLLITITTAAAVIIGGLCVFRYLLK
uniref:ANK_REP_REGION domain-containing protein n=1 Tax=Strongyloides venezuelensis TaxID=75913 RepID=A0A0K0FVD8_STRVS